MKYYVVYSFKKVDGSTGSGRNTITCEHPIDSIERIEAVESVLRGQQPDMESLFVLSWIEIKSEEAPPEGTWRETAARWLEQRAEIHTNSLHCGDSSTTIQRTHEHARKLRSVAKEIREGL